MFWVWPVRWCACGCLEIWSFRSQSNPVGTRLSRGTQKFRVRMVRYVVKLVHIMDLFGKLWDTAFASCLVPYSSIWIRWCKGWWYIQNFVSHCYKVFSILTEKMTECRQHTVCFSYTCKIFTIKDDSRNSDYSSIKGSLITHTKSSQKLRHKSNV